MKIFTIILFMLFASSAYATSNQDHTCQGGHNCNGGSPSTNEQGQAQDQSQDQGQDQGQTQTQDVNVENNVSLLGGNGSVDGQGGGDGSVEIGTNTNTFTEAPSASYAYAAVCGTGLGGGTLEFTGSVSGESQHCKYLRMAAFYEGMYREAVARDDNPMARIWYTQMATASSQAQSLVESTAWTGAAKETTADLALPVILCGAAAVVTVGWAGAACAAIIAGKATLDHKKVKEAGELPNLDLYIDNTDFTARPDAAAAELLK